MKHVLHYSRQLLGLGWALLVVLACVSCTCGQNRASTTMLTEVWTQPDWPPGELPAPGLFKLTPREAYTIVAQSKALSLKHRWFCFRDEQYYYIADAFGRRVQAQTALKHGVRVDGRTGVLATP